MMRILNLDPDNYAPEALALLRTVAEVDAERLTRTELLRRIGRYDAIVLRFSHQIDAEMIAAAPRLKAIATNATGLDHIDEAAAEARGIQIVSLRGETAFLETVPSTAEHTWGLLLALTRRIVPANASVRGGTWDRDRFIGVDLAGRRLGVLGVGRVGRKVAAFGRAFGMHVRGFDRKPVTDIPCAETLRELLETSDVLSVHVPLDRTTRGLIGAAEIAFLPEGAVIINTARGAIVDEDALLAALRTGRIAGAALDVLVGEPDIANHPLVAFARENPSLLLTPHLGGATWDSWRRTEVFVAERLREILAGR